MGGLSNAGGKLLQLAGNAVGSLPEAGRPGAQGGKLRPCPVCRGWAWTRALMGVPANEVHLCGDGSGAAPPLLLTSWLALLLAGWCHRYRAAAACVHAG